MPDDLFDAAATARRQRSAPLADRMRPRTLDEFAGQGHLLAQGKLLRRAVEADRVTSLILFGPPGTGKTTLARIIANTTSKHFASLNAVLAGVADIRAQIDAARQRLKHHGQGTILFVDEVHRFNKSQQDALLPHVENGTVTFVGATTENPYFEVNKALVSRSRIFELQPLTEADLEQIARQALGDPDRGYGRQNVVLAPEAMAHLVSTSNGDARSILGALELAVETTPPAASGAIEIGLLEAEESIQKRAVLYDKDGDAHYDTISAFIKSMRGSDPDAALYWMAKMIYAGEDPRFVFRRMLIFAGEDIGMADPNAMRMAVACAEAFDRVGMPEGRFMLAECCLYLATAPKSNSGFAFFSALAHVEKERTEDPPNALKDGSRDKKGLGHGKGYKYPHAYQDHYVPEQYLPGGMQGTYFYEPSDQGYEGRLRVRLEQLRARDEAESIEKRVRRYAEEDAPQATGTETSGESEAPEASGES
ncbi:AAA family ATPase [Rubricoccus marinus]|uniref:Replication-associated recombination protein A n=1 Tax=Rubricoccus marinus TaxID=716817 RepID=A0A259TWI4_9BACT|nr:AAA family ATPase [Rubricoccus marinus]OZC02081.1 AAA family ATPase [Rubricoccus marinus]